VRKKWEPTTRMPLDPPRGGVLRLILREGLLMALAGAALGFLLALSAARLFSGVLYQVSPLDPFAFTIAPAVILGTALLASYLPARRASKVDPMVALRYE
jgi:putative ABC transport system permease protein